MTQPYEYQYPSRVYSQLCLHRNQHLNNKNNHLYMVHKKIPPTHTHTSSFWWFLLLCRLGCHALFETALWLMMLCPSPPQDANHPFSWRVFPSPQQPWAYQHSTTMQSYSLSLESSPLVSRHFHVCIYATHETGIQNHPPEWKGTKFCGWVDGQMNGSMDKWMCVVSHLIKCQQILLISLKSKYILTFQI